MLSSVVSDTFGKSALAILLHLLKHPDNKDYDFRPLLHGSMLKKQDDIALAIDGTISKVQADKITLCLSHMDDIKNYITQIFYLKSVPIYPFFIRVAATKEPLSPLLE